MKRFTLLAAALLSASIASAQEPDALDEGVRAAQFLDSLKFQTGAIPLPAAHATLKLSDSFRFLDNGDTQRVLTELWQNPPGAGADALGMLVPSNIPLTDENSWAVIVTYSDEGYVSDAEAAEIDYSEMLGEMQEETLDSNEAREEAGYGKVELVGWATQPHYDAAAKKLHWAKELEFNDDPDHTLNYDIRVLGRGGYLSFNAVADMRNLATVQTAMSDVLSMAEFEPGNTYADFNPDSDKVAAYGIGALVAGGLAAKAGLFGKLAVLLLAGKKFVILALVGVAALLGKIFMKKKAT